MDVRAEPAGTVTSLVGVDQVPPAVRSLATIAEPDYVDLFTIETPAAAAASAEQWSRAILEEAPVSKRNARRLWQLMGLRLGPPGSPDHVQGWAIGARHDDWVRLETASWYLTAQAVCMIEAGQVSVSLALRYDLPVAAPVWAVVSGPHQRAVPVMLRQAVKVMSRPGLSG